MSDNRIELGNLDMLRALYDFNASFAKTLSFRENDHFILHQTSTKQRNWWQVVNESGQMGFVPSNYVTTIKVTPQFLIQFIDNCIDSLHKTSGKTGLSADKQELILRLSDKKRQAELSNHKKGVAPKPPDHFNDTSVSEVTKPLHKKVDHESSNSRRSPGYSPSAAAGDGINNIPGVNMHKNELYEEPIKQHHKKDRKHTGRGSTSPSETKVLSDTSVSPNSQKNRSITSPRQENLRKLSLFDVEQKPVYELVETVRRNTQLSHELSRVAVVTVIEGLQEILPSNFERYFKTILTHLEGSLNASEPLLNQTHDATRLKVIFNELTSCKEDSQQRSWMLHEDEMVIMDYIHELISILSNADANISRHVMSQDQYSGVTNLIQYYQMEVRWSIRQLLLQAFGVMCSLDRIVVNIMLNSVLPVELARDMKTNSRNMQRLNYSSLLLTMICSMGEKMPITHLEHFDFDFMMFLYTMIENPPDVDVEDQIPDLFLNLILSFNLQFQDGDENIVVSTASKVEDAKTFTEKLLLLLNREEDPVRIFDHEPAPPNSVIKLFIDLFSNVFTAELFYTNDVKVLIDIIVRQLSDISPGDSRRAQYLELCRRVLRNTNYSDHYHRRDDILKCFTRIFCEETEVSQEDQKLVRKISNEFPEYFKK